MRTRLLISAILFFGVTLLTYPTDVHCQILRVTGGNVELELDPPPAAGLDPVPATDQRTRLRWIRIPLLPTKVVVSTVISGQAFQLFVSAASITGGTAAPEVELTEGMLPQDFIVNISRIRPVGQARLSYRAEAPAELGNSATHGDDVHTVIYTWTSQ